MNFQYCPILAIEGAQVILAVVMLVAGMAVFAVISKLIGLKTIGEAKKQAQQIITDGENESNTIRKQIELDARTEMAKLREQFEKESNQQRNELKDIERRLTKREDTLDRKLDMLSTKEKDLEQLDQQLKQREQSIRDKTSRLDQLINERKRQNEKAAEEQKQILLRISNLSPEDARKEALKLVEQEVQHEAGQLIKKVTESAEQDARDSSRKITLQAIQRYASEHTSAATVNTIAIPSDDMKGRVIGREGRNIRAFEKASGVDVIVDDTPGVIVVSCFNPIRRAIAAESMQKLLEDGRIHPSRIEEIVEQTTKEFEERINRMGKEACIEANIRGLHPRIVEMVGRLHYRTSYGQNILRHSIEVAFLCQVIADELGLDGDIARRCGFLHDIGKAMDHEIEGGHPAIGSDFCKKFNEREEVLNAIAGHHNDIPATSLYTPIVAAADAISGARPGARRETLELYVKRLEQLEEIATSMKGVKEAYAIQAGREVRVIVDPENVDDANCSYIARDIAKRVSDEMTFPGEIRVTVLREMRTIDYAR